MTEHLLVYLPISAIPYLIINDTVYVVSSCIIGSCEETQIYLPFIII